MQKHVIVELTATSDMQIKNTVKILIIFLSLNSKHILPYKIPFVNNFFQKVLKFFINAFLFLSVIVLGLVSASLF